MSASPAVLALHRHLESTHWRDDALIGPDPGLRFNYRIGRFVKGTLPWLPWRDGLYYLQAQAYWLIGNLRLNELTGEPHYAEIAFRGSHGIVARQTPDGAWLYPNPAWKGRVANAEGTWAALGLVESFRSARDDRFLDAALRWHRYLESEIGWQPAGRGEAAKYFAGRDTPPIPNNSAAVLRLLGELTVETGEVRYLERVGGLVAFLADAQRPSGEMPYAFGPSAPRRLDHFQCFQYNAFECLDLLRYKECSGDDRVLPIVSGILRFLSTGVTPDGRWRHDCDRPYPEVAYHGAVLAAALRAGEEAGLTERGVAARVHARVRDLQAGDGSFPHSLRNYRLVPDRRSYPRSQAMILVHLLALEAADARATGDRS